MRSHKAIVHEALAAGIALLVIAAPATSAPPGPFKQTNIHFETNASGCDMGIQMSFDTSDVTEVFQEREFHDAVCGVASNRVALNRVA